MLAVSDFRGSICLLDLMDDYRTLAQTTIPGVCGMIKFSPDFQCLYCLNSASCELLRLDVNVGDDGGLSLDISHPWGLESGSEPGFLLGDPFYVYSIRGFVDLKSSGLDFVLNKQSVLRSWDFDRRIIEMRQLDEVTKDLSLIHI